jgi:lipoprotein-releasing system permease protein
MRFELTVALKYLIPKWRQLSVSIISLISVLVISLVVWLVVLFLSVTDGIERKWIDELIALNAPLRMTPTEAYYQSYYYEVDGISLDSNYTTKTIGEKLVSLQTEPYDPTIDQELSQDFPIADRDADGKLKDIVKEGYAAIQALPFKGVRPQEFEISFGNLRLQLLREETQSGEVKQSFITQVSYIAAHDGENCRVNQMVIPPTAEDFQNLHHALSQTNLPDLKRFYDSLALNAGHLDPTALGEGLLIAKHFKKNGVMLGDQGYISYYASAGSSMQEQRIPIYIAGFYDPGMMPVGNKLLFADRAITAQLRSNLSVSDPMLGNGINIWIQDISEAASVKKNLLQALEEKGIGKYWDVQSYHDYEFTKPILDQLQSDKNLFALIALIILVVACSNIISMLILLVNDKKKEIGILQSLGASPKRIAVIFGLCGFATGLISCVIGTIAALLTLKNLQSLVDILSFFQGREAFQSVFYGSKLPNDVSVEALIFVSVATLMISLLAGIIPAVKAARIRPTEILKMEG